jgi:hypothetical protein
MYWDSESCIPKGRPQRLSQKQNFSFQEWGERIKENGGGGEFKHIIFDTL